MTPEQIVVRFINAWNQIDFDTVVAMLTDDVVYHNIPMDALEGKPAAEAFIRGIDATSIQWDMLNICAKGNVVLTERLDKFTLSSGAKLSVPVMGVFEIQAGKIHRWRDYYDQQTFVEQMSGTPIPST